MRYALAQWLDNSFASLISFSTLFPNKDHYPELYDIPVPSWIVFTNYLYILKQCVVSILCKWNHIMWVLSSNMYVPLVNSIFYCCVLTHCKILQTIIYLSTSCQWSCFSPLSFLLLLLYLFFVFFFLSWPLHTNECVWTWLFMHMCKNFLKEMNCFFVKSDFRRILHLF